VNSPRPHWLARSWWTADRVSRAGLVTLVLFMTLRLGRDDHPAAPVAALVVLAVSLVLLLLAISLRGRERRHRQELTPPPDPPGR
jgi:hypothetical protein